MNEVLQRLPHRSPMLMIDKILHLDGSTCTALKCVTHNEPCLQGHFPGNPLFPGALLVEAMAQTAALILSEKKPGCLPVFAGIEHARFRRPVLPGDQLLLSAEQQDQKDSFYTFSAAASVNGTVAAEAALTIYVQEQ